VDDSAASHATMLLAVPLLYDKMFKRISKSIQETQTAGCGPLIKAGNF
jgi:hypothetical protein